MGIIRLMRRPSRGDFLPSQVAQGIVEDIDVSLDDDGYEVVIRRAYWTRNKRRALQDQRGNIIRTEDVLTMNAHEAADLVAMLASTLVHAQNPFTRPKED